MIYPKIDKVLLGLVAVALVGAIGCGDDDEPNTTTNNATTNNATTNNATTNNSTSPNVGEGTARVQVIHNAPDPGAATVDVYVNDELFLDDFAFRTATGYVEVPAGVELDIDVAPPTSTSSDERLNPDGAFTYTLEADSYTSLVASGVLDPESFAANPDGNDTAFTLIPVTGQRTAPEDPANIDVRVLHGSPDAPTVDAVLPTGDALVDDAAYGDVTDYLAVPGGGVVTLDITTADQETFVEAFQTTGGVAGVTAIVAASGFLDPSANAEGPGFGLYVFLGSDAADTTASPAIPLPLAARAQIIHNSADPAAASVDVFINDAEAVSALAFRTATPYVTLPSGVELDIDVAAAADDNTSEDRVNADGAFVATLDPGSTSVIMASGFLNPGDFEANPSGNDTAFSLYFLEGREASDNLDEFQFNVFHGASDAPAIDVAVGGDASNLLVDNLSYGNATGFQGVPSGTYELGLKPAGAPIENVIVTYNVPAVAFIGQAGTVVASGFLSPDDGTDPDTPFALLLFGAGGGAAIPVPTL